MKLKNKGINQFITEEILGECWHEAGDLQTVCRKCGNADFNRVSLRNRDFSTPTDWWYLMDFCTNSSKLVT